MKNIRPIFQNRLTKIIILLTLFALFIRFVFIGDRIAHWDEARVALWTLNYLETGEFHYRYIIHGPFVQIVNRLIFAVLGANDFTARAIVALIGGLLPLTALLFREHLRDVEIIGLAFLLAANPILLYYSRFFRSSLLIAAFMFTAFGLFVRAYDTRQARYVHAAIVFVALGFTAKENAAIYLLVWLGAVVLLIDHELFRPYSSTTGFQRINVLVSRFIEKRSSWRSWMGHYGTHALLGVGLFAIVIVFFYAPRTSNPSGLGLWQAVGHPGRFPHVIDAMIADIIEGYTYWFGGASEPGCNKTNVIDGYLCFLGLSLQVLAGFGAVVVTFGFVGFIVERYRANKPRNLVMFASYWGFVSMVGYPLGADVFGAWFLVNVIIPLAIPAAVTLGLVYRWGRDAWKEDDVISAGLAGLVLVLVIGQIGMASVTGVYLSPQDPGNKLVQFAQPAGDFRPELREIERFSGTSSGPDVLLYGEWLVDGDTDAVRSPACAKWFNALPLPWYIAANDWTVECAINQSQLNQQLDRNPSAVITRANSTEKLPPAVGASEPLDGYTAVTYEFRASDQSQPPKITIFLRTTPASE